MKEKNMGLVSSLLICLKTSASFIFFTSLHLIRFTLLSIFLHPSINPLLFLGKRSDGTFPIWSRVIFCPFLYFLRAFSVCIRFAKEEAPYTEICQGLYVGGWPYSPDKLPPGKPAVIDCTCELPRKKELLGHAYLCIPVWDTRAPVPAQIESAVKFACRMRAQNVPVFIHCAYGHGRSVTVMCAVLIALGLAEDWRDAEELVKERRPSVRMNALQHKALEEWSKDRLSPYKKRENLTGLE